MTDDSFKVSGDASFPVVDDYLDTKFKKSQPILSAIDYIQYKVDFMTIDYFAYNLRK